MCRCGFRERADKLHQERKQQRGASKQEVQRYLKKQQAQDKGDTGAFAAAWAKMLEQQKKEESKQ